MIVELIKPVFVPGEAVRGRVKLMLYAPTELFGLEARFIGSEDCAVKTGGFFKKTHTSSIILMDYRMSLSQYQNLPPGEYAFEFNQQVPMNALPTYHGTNVKVSYTIEIVMNPGKKEEKASVPFWVKQNGQLMALSTRGVRYSFPTNAQAPYFYFDLNQTAYFANSAVAGALTIMDHRPLLDLMVKKVDITMVSIETVKMNISGKDQVFYDEKVQGKVMYALGELAQGALKPFQIPISPTAFSSYRGHSSSLRWFLRSDFGVPNPFPQEGMKNLGQQYEIEIINIA